ncbi:MAG: hypothetical protein ACRD1T_27755, partial [Acidimicrobiia bacterium]
GEQDDDDRSVVDFGPLTANDKRTTYAIACERWKIDGARIIETDIRINANKDEVRFFASLELPEVCKNTDPSDDRYDLIGLMTHERGHSFGLGHVGEHEHGALTMSKDFNGACQRSERTLGRGDKDGLKELYT